MNRIEKWFLKRIIEKEVKPTGSHSDNITNLYKLIKEACVKEYTEDNQPTMDCYLRELFESTQFEPVGISTE